MQTRFRILLIYTLFASEANSPTECDHYIVVMEIKCQLIYLGHELWSSAF